MCDKAKLTTKFGRTDVKLSMTSELVGELGLGVACNAFSLADTTCDKAMLTTKLVMSDIESAVTVG